MFVAKCSPTRARTCLPDPRKRQLIEAPPRARPELERQEYYDFALDQMNDPGLFSAEASIDGRGIGGGSRFAVQDSQKRETSGAKMSNPAGTSRWRCVYRVRARPESLGATAPPRAAPGAAFREEPREHPLRGPPGQRQDSQIIACTHHAGRLLFCAIRRI